MLAGGADAAIIPSGVAGFISCKALSKRNEDPTRASRPWDRQRDGFVIGEGAGGCHMVYAVVQLAYSPAGPEAILAFQPGADYANISRSEEVAASVTRAPLLEHCGGLHQWAERWLCDWAGRCCHADPAHQNH